MSTPVIAFFNNKGGVGKTSLVYHLAWMYSDLGMRVVAADFDPQANLSAAFLDDDRLEQLWPEGVHPQTVFGFVQPLMRGVGDISEPHLEMIEEKLALIVGDLALSGFEDSLSEVWPKCNDGDERSFRVISAFWRLMQKAAEEHAAEVVLMDLGPNLGAINRAALISADYVVIPLAPDLYSIQGLKNLGPTLIRWRKEWTDRVSKNPAADLSLPQGRMEPAGYVILQHMERLNRPVKAYQKWAAEIPFVYRRAVLGEDWKLMSVGQPDVHCLTMLKHYRSLMPMAQEARKPIFHLKAADGAIGSCPSGPGGAGGL